MENNIRLGKISAIDYAAGTVRVVYHEKDDAVTAPIPLISSEYFMPEVDDMVMVLHLSNGTEAGVVLGRPWSEKNKPPEGSKGLYRKDLARSPGEAMIRYKDGTLTIKAAKVVIDGTVTVTGDVTANGVSLDNHTHTDSMGGGTTGPSYKRRESKRTRTYYCHPYCSSERGSNEKQNQMIRRKFPKGTNFDKVTQKDVEAVESWLNRYPRQLLGWASAGQLFEGYLQTV